MLHASSIVFDKNKLLQPPPPPDSTAKVSMGRRARARSRLSKIDHGISEIDHGFSDSDVDGILPFGRVFKSDSGFGEFVQNHI